VVTTLAGTSPGFLDGVGTAARFNAPTGLAVLPDGNIVITELGNQRIRRVTYPGGVVTTLAGNGTAAFADGTGTGASFNYPQGVAALPDGNIVVADSDNRRIRLVTQAGVVTTYAGSGADSSVNATGTAASFRSVRGVAVDRFTDRVYVGEYGGGNIRQITLPYS
jgi:hypothetical protein